MNIHRIDKPGEPAQNLQSPSGMGVVVIHDSKEVFLEAMTDWLKQNSSFDVVNGDSSQSGVLDLVFELKPCLVICMVSDHYSDYALVSEISSISQKTNIAYVTNEISSHKIMKILKKEPRSLISLSDSRHEFLSFLERISRGELCYSSCFEDSVKLFHRTQSNPWNLTERQMQILEHLAIGLTVRETASKLFLSPKSVDSHKYRIMKKLNLHDRVHLSRFAIREGLIDP